MMSFKGSSAAAAVTVSILALSTAAEARHLRYIDYQPTYACGEIPPPARLHIYPSANWEPFFRRHVYRFGPIVACERTTAPEAVISVRY
jgi:hypothetical protein